MGCCASTDNPSSDPQLLRHSSVTKLNREQPPPLLPIIEEETVKEVLSETPKPKPKIPKMEDELKKMPPKEELHKIQEEEGKNFSQKKPTLMNAEEISEICSNFSLSESVSTTTITEKRDNDDDDGDGEVLQRINRSPAKFRNRAFSADLSSRRERVVGRSPVKRSDQSRSRVKSFSGVERRGYFADGRRRESGENSGRRSRSPATRTESGVNRLGSGRSPAMRKVGNSPGRVKPKPLGKGDEGNEEVVKLNSAATGNELLENPLVSLECFIFL